MNRVTSRRIEAFALKFFGVVATTSDSSSQTDSCGLRSAVKTSQRLWRAQVLLFVLSAGLCSAQTIRDPLQTGFEYPPESARPRVWWHWMDNNISKEGIRLDLEWMHRAGLGGVQIINGSLFGKKVVDPPVIYMSPEWKDAFKYATTLADQMGFEEAIGSSPGFSETGGPWVPPNEAMKKYVWSELHIAGGQPFKGILPHPPSNTGAFQNLPIEDVGGMMSPQITIPEFYADTAVLAYKVPKTDLASNSLHPTITSSSPIDRTLLDDGDLVRTTSLVMPEAAGEKAWIQYAFSEAQTIRAITIVAGKRNAFDGYLRAGRPSGITLEASDDGKTYKPIVRVTKGGSTEHTLSFAPVTAKYFRVTFSAPPPPAPGSEEAQFGSSSKSPSSIPIAELVLHPGARVNEFEEKAGFDVAPELYSLATPSFSPEDAIKKSDVIDLTRKMLPDGTLEWTPPPGDWVVLRFGYSLLGVKNHPAAKEATGLEVDKLSARYMRNYMDHYLDTYKSAVGAELMGKRGLNDVLTDSWEAGAQNWTDDMIEEFRKRRGYDPHPWLPVLTGRIVTSSQASDQFLWDLRKTIADLTADEDYGQIEASLKARGMGHYGESHEGDRGFVADGMEVKKLDDVPMGAMWVHNPGVFKEQFELDNDDRESASVAHIYGQNVAAAESFTVCDVSTAWAWSPATLKPTADQEFLNGINLFVIHESTHQPLTGKVPGITMGPCGQWFNRNETWAEHAQPWIEYLSRNSFLLQQGRFATDVLYFYGEDSNITAIFHTSMPDIPEGYAFDYINADGLIHAVRTDNGRITTRSGMSYRVLVLDKFSQHMSLPVLRAIHTLVEQGATVAGEKPIETPSLADDPAEFKKLSDDLFGEGSGTHIVGKGKVYAGQNAKGVLRELNVGPDFYYTRTADAAQVLFVHRKLTDGDLYFLANRRDRPATIDATFRVTGKAPELWYSDTGRISPAPYEIAQGHTTVPLHLDPWGTVFVVFRKPAAKKSRVLPKAVETQLATVNGPWELAFEPDRGAPPHITLDKLISWSDSPDKGIRYFSGEGTYTTTIQADASWFGKNATLWIDLGEVKNLAMVTVNGKELGTVWHAPYTIDATSALKPGANEISVKVINSWVNRLIGDQQPDATTKYTFTTWKSYKADSPLLPSGLIGPVAVLRKTEQ